MSAAPTLGRRERKKQALRDKIYHETLTLIQNHGIDGLTIDAICDRVDIAKKTFYNYYSSKHDLLIDICQRHLLNNLDHLLKAATTRHQTLRLRLDYIFETMVANNTLAGQMERQLVAYITSSLSTNPKEGSAPLIFMNDCFRTLFNAGESELKPNLNPDFCAEMTVGMINAIMLNWLYDDSYDIQQRFTELLGYIKTSMLP